jgi:hypothetical protein
MVLGRANGFDLRFEGLVCNFFSVILSVDEIN